MATLSALLFQTACASDQNLSPVSDDNDEQNTPDESQNSWGITAMGAYNVVEACLPPDISIPVNLETGESNPTWMDKDQIMSLLNAILYGGKLEISDWLTESQIDSVEYIDDEDGVFDFAPYSSRADISSSFIDGVYEMSGVVTNIEMYEIREDSDENIIGDASSRYVELMAMAGEHSDLLATEVEDVTPTSTPTSWGGGSGSFENVDRLSDKDVEATQPLTLICSSNTRTSANLEGEIQTAVWLSYHVGYRPHTTEFRSETERGASVEYLCLYGVCQQDLFVADVSNDGGTALSFSFHASSQSFTYGAGSITNTLGDMNAQGVLINSIINNIDTESLTNGDSTLISGGFYINPTNGQ